MRKACHVLVLAAFMLTGCWLLVPRPTRVNVETSVGPTGSVAFNVGKAIEQEPYFHRDQYLLTGIDVYDSSGLDQKNARLIWSMQPMAKAVAGAPSNLLPARIVYGDTPPGMVEQTKAEPLQPGRLYSANIGITAQDHDGSNKIGFLAVASFTLVYGQGQPAVVQPFPW